MGWVLESESRDDKRIWWSAGDGWVYDQRRALRFARREDAEAFFSANLEGVGKSAWAVDLQKTTA